MRGNLEIPEGVEIKWGEPAILGQINAETPLFLTAPTHPKSDYNVSDLLHPKEEKSLLSSLSLLAKPKKIPALMIPTFLKKSPEVKFVDPAVKPFERKSKAHSALACRPKAGIDASSVPVHPDCVALQPGTQVFVRYHREWDNSINKNVYEVSLVAQPKPKPGEVRSDMPELNRDMKSTGVLGYVFREDITSANVDEYLIKMKGDIFKEHGDKEDVRQAVFGNCFFLAAVAAILSKPNGYAYFQSIIKQEDEDTSVVKLYDYRQKKWVYVRVDNTIFCEGYDDTLQHRQNWIHILEKAYVGLGVIKYDKSTIVEVYPSYREIYGKGGEVADAYRALTGNEPTEVDINSLTQSQSVRISSDMVNMVMGRVYMDDSVTDWQAIEDKLYVLHGGSPASDHLDENTLRDNEYAKRMAVKTVMHLRACFETVDNFKIFSRFWKEERRHCPDEDIKNALSKKMTKLDDRRNAATMTEMMSFINTCLSAGLAPAVGRKMLDYVKSALPDGTYPYLGPLGSGMYTEYHLEVYRMLEEYFQAGKIISAGTNLVEAGAKAMPGLRTPHAYSILSVAEEKDNGVTLYFVKLRNTWGRVGREYYSEKDGQMLAREKEHRGNFRLELGDFVNAMHGIAVSEVPDVEVKLQEALAPSVGRRPC